MKRISNSRAIVAYDRHGEKSMAHDAAMQKAGALSKGSPSSGRDDLNTLAVKSLKVVAKACSQEAQ